jgi:hypothetical protein
MADAPPPHLDAAAIKSLVEEVVRRIRAGVASGTAFHSHPAGGSPLPVGEGGRSPGDGVSIAPRTAGTLTPTPLPKGEGISASLADAVITLAHVERVPAGTRELAVSARAVITPSARDRAREAGITIVRHASTAAAVASPSRPFVIAQADGRGGATGRAAAIARLVPHAQRLPATGLADVVATLALHVSRDAARGVLLTSRPATALILANRAPGLRAVTARDPAGLAAAAAETAANLLVFDPAAFAGGLERACADFAARPAGPVPPELAQGAAGCGCKAHPH